MPSIAPMSSVFIKYVTENSVRQFWYFNTFKIISQTIIRLTFLKVVPSFCPIKCISNGIIRFVLSSTFRIYFYPRYKHLLQEHCHNHLTQLLSSFIGQYFLLIIVNCLLEKVVHFSCTRA